MSTLIAAGGASVRGSVWAVGPHRGRRPAADRSAGHGTQPDDRPARRPRPATSAPWLRRRHPSAPSGRPGGAPGPALTPGLPAGGADGARLAAGAAARSLAAPLPAEAAPQVAPARHRQARAARAPQVARAVPRGGAWRLTDRGIAVVLVLFTVLMTASLVVVVDRALAVSAPDSGYASTR